MRSERSFPLLAAAGFFVALGARGQVDLEWKHGAGGLHRGNALVPFHARLENPTAEDRVIDLEGTWDGAGATVARRVDLAAGARKELDLFLGPAAQRSGFRVRIKGEGKELYREAIFSSVWVDPATTVVGLLHPHPMGWGGLQAAPGRRSSNRRTGERPAFEGKVVHLEAKLLPSHVEGLRTFDLLIWPQPRPRELSGEQTRALGRWIESGGHLVLATAAAGPYVLGPWTGVDVDRAVAVNDLRALAAAGGAPLGPLAEPLAAVALEPAGGEVWLEESWGAIAVDERRGAGRVTVLGFDPSAPPVDRWAGLGRFWLEILRRGGHAARPRTPLTTNRFAPPLDLRETARFLLTRNVVRIDLPLTGLGLLFLLYLAIIGPGEYLALRRLGRLKWTWWTFPAWVAVFSLGAYGVVAGSKGDVARVRHVLVRDLVPGAERFAEELHAALFVTRSGEYRLASRAPDALPIPAAGGFGTARVHLQGEGAIAGRVAKWSFLAGSFVAAAPVGTAEVESELRWRNGRLEGRILPHLGTDLEEAWVLAAVAGYPVLFPLGRVRDGASVSLAGLEPESLSAEGVQETWLEDPRNLADLARFLVAETSRRLLAQRLQESSGRLDRYLDDPHPHHDWSSSLEAGGAVLIGWASDGEQRVAPLGFEAESEGVVIYRVLLATS